MWTLNYLIELVKNDLLKMQSIHNKFETCYVSASYRAIPKAAAPGSQLLKLIATSEAPSALNDVLAHHLAETAQYVE